MAQFLGDVSAAQTAAGSTQADATAAFADHVQIPTASAGQGVILKPGNTQDFRSVCNASSVSLYIYPPYGAAFNGRAANAPIDLPPGAAALFFFVNTLKINAFI
jgi:hypothetical protein